MFHNRRPDDPMNPEWTGVRTSKQEGRHAYYHASLPGTIYSPHLARAIIGCRLGALNVQAAAQRGLTSACSLADAHHQEKKRIMKDRGWSDYDLPAALPVPDSTHERFGVDFVPGKNVLAAALDAQQTGKAAAPLSAKEEEVFFEGELSSVSLGVCVYVLLRLSAACHCSCQREPMCIPCLQAKHPSLCVGYSGGWRLARILCTCHASSVGPCFSKYAIAV